MKQVDGIPATQEDYRRWNKLNPAQTEYLPHLHSKIVFKLEGDKHAISLVKPLSEAEMDFLLAIFDVETARHIQRANRMDTNNLNRGDVDREGFVCPSDLRYQFRREIAEETQPSMDRVIDPSMLADHQFPEVSDEELKARVEAKLSMTPAGRACFVIKIKEKLTDVELAYVLRLYDASAAEAILAISSRMSLPPHPRAGDTYTLIEPTLNESGLPLDSDVQHIKIVSSKPEPFFPTVAVDPHRVSNPPTTSTSDIEEALSFLLEARDDIVMDATICGIPGETVRRFIDDIKASGAKPTPL